MRVTKCICTGLLALALASGGLVATANAQDSCTNEFVCEDLFAPLCDAGGFLITLVDYDPAPPSNGGFASYTYEICSPSAGVCGGGTGLRAGESCLENDFCRSKGGDEDPGASCNRDCAVDDFHDLSHFDVGLPALGVGSCLPEGTDITGSCTAGDFFEVGQDGSCGNAFVAKCDAGLDVGECYQMTINIPGELNAPGLGAAFVVSKEAGDCNESCIAGPSCEACDVDDAGSECLTRTRGFWGTHPHIIEELDILPITVCGVEQSVTEHGVCGTSEALCTNASDRKSNPTSLTLVAQLTAAKLNLEATLAVTDGAGSCADWEYDGKSIQDWITYCELNYCDANKNAISGSGCIEALDDFNNSLDTGFDQTPSPFDHPGPALVDECQLARGNNISNYDCQ